MNNVNVWDAAYKYLEWNGYELKAGIGDINLVGIDPENDDLVLFEIIQADEDGFAVDTPTKLTRQMFEQLSIRVLKMYSDGYINNCHIRHDIVEVNFIDNHRAYIRHIKEAGFIEGR